MISNLTLDRFVHTHLEPVNFISTYLKPLSYTWCRPAPACGLEITRPSLAASQIACPTNCTAARVDARRLVVPCELGSFALILDIVRSSAHYQLNQVFGPLPAWPARGRGDQEKTSSFSRPSSYAKLGRALIPRHASPSYQSRYNNTVQFGL